MKQVYLKKAKRSAKFNYVFPADVPLNYNEELGSIQHPTKEVVWLKVDAKDVRDVITHNEKSVNTGGTSLLGYVTADYADLKKAFGKPLDGDGYKVDAEWELEFPDGKVATIYNWKDGKAYCGSSGTPKTKITDWHVGGNEVEVVNRVKAILTKL